MIPNTNRLLPRHFRLFILYCLDKRNISKIALTLTSLFIITCIITFGYLNSTEGNEKLNREALNLVWDYDSSTSEAVLSGNYNYSMSQGNNCDFKMKKKTGVEGCPDLIYIRANITGMDAIQNRFKMQAQFFPFGKPILCCFIKIKQQCLFTQPSLFKQEHSLLETS